MANYIWSDANRFYAATESLYGIPAPVTATNRFAGYKFDCHQSVESVRRRDKTGARTYLGSPATATRRSSFEVNAHLVSWVNSAQPGYGPLVQAAMGAGPEFVQGLVVATANSVEIQTQDQNSLSIGSPVSSGGEIRFVTAVQNSSLFTLNAPFSVA